MANAELSRRVEKVVGYPPLREMGADQRREFHEALLEGLKRYRVSSKAGADFVSGWSVACRRKEHRGSNKRGRC